MWAIDPCVTFEPIFCCSSKTVWRQKTWICCFFWVAFGMVAMQRESENSCKRNWRTAATTLKFWVGVYYKLQRFRAFERSEVLFSLDPLEQKLGEVHQPLHFYRNPKDAPQILHKINEKIKAADGFVVVAAEYNSAIVPSLCAIMDHFPPVSYQYRPSTPRCKFCFCHDYR